MQLKEVEFNGAELTEHLAKRLLTQAYNAGYTDGVRFGVFIGAIAMTLAISATAAITNGRKKNHNNYNH